jgi:hypothetical protein
MPTSELKWAWREALSWWLVGELVRRHPELEVWNDVPNDGFQDLLGLSEVQQGQTSHRAMVNRNGAVNFAWSGTESIQNWAMRLLADEDGHRLVKEIENGANLVAPEKTPKATAKTLGVRLIARMLLAEAMSKNPWKVTYTGQMEFCEAVGYLEQQRMFPSISGPETPLVAGEAAVELTRRWILHKGEAEPVCLVDLNGAVHFRDGKSEYFLKTYESSGRQLEETMVRVFGPVL